MFNFLGRVIHYWKVFSRPFQRYITSPHKIKEILQSFSDCRASSPKELQWENDNVFYKCIEGKSGICLLLAMFIGEDWMVNLMIIYIKTIIAKALDFNDIIKKLLGCQLNESKSPNKQANSTTH
jgi:hypothetical protein